jgi:protein-S-isoprenylcysteine O-methyltransferase Ste14
LLRGDKVRALEHRIPPPILAVVFAAAIWGLSKLVPGVEASRMSRAMAAIPVALVGAYFTFAGVRTFGRAKTTVNPLKPETASSLVTAGIYTVTRNPMYLGLAITLLAWTIYLASPWALALVAGFVLYIDRLQIRPEERALASLFGSAYEQYKARVRRWL